MVIRYFQKGDVGGVIDLIHRNLLEVNAKRYPPGIMEALVLEYTPEAVSAAAQNRTVIVAIEAGSVIGTASLRKDGWIVDVFVDPAHHVKGIGSKLMIYLEKLAVEKGQKSLTLPASITAVGFYSSLGYRMVREDLAGDARAEIIMAKDL